MQKIYKSDSKIKNIGIRHGEKVHDLLSKEMFSLRGSRDYFRIPADNRDLNYDKYFTKVCNQINLKSSIPSIQLG